MTRQAVILAGGKGTRLRERLQGRPKPLIDVDGVPLLGRQMQLLAKNGFSEVLILVNHAADQIEAYCRENNFGLSVSTLDDGEAKGTAGAVLSALDRLRSRFLVVYGDTLLDVDLARFWAAHEQGAAAATLFLHPNDHPADSDLVELDEDGTITGFYSYPHPEGALLPNLVNAALYMMERDALIPWKDAAPPLDFAKDLFPQMVAAGTRLRGYATFEYIKDIGTPARLDKAVKHLRTGVVERARLSTRQRAVFLDRDGTLNELAGYVRHHTDLIVLPGVPEAVRRLNDAEYRVVVITNQPVIARGEASLQDLRALHNKLETELGRKGAWLDLILFCPHHPDAGFPGEVTSLKVRCCCRKPEPGLIKEARDRLNVDLSRSWFVGDSSVDMLASRRAGLRSILVRTGERGEDGRFRISPDLTVADVPAAARFIVETYPAMQERLRPLAQAVRPGDVVLLGGGTTSETKTVARVLAWTLGEQGVDASCLDLDRFLRSGSSPGCDSDPASYEVDTALQLLDGWLAGRDTADLALPWFDRREDRSYPGNETLSLRPNTILVLQGPPALSLSLPGGRRVHRAWIEDPGSLQKRDVRRHPYDDDWNEPLPVDMALQVQDLLRE